MPVITREQARWLERENAKWPAVLQPVPKEDWPDANPPTGAPFEVWRSRDFLVQVFDGRPGAIRMSVNRTSYNTKTQRWDENISWDELQRLKREIGRGMLDAVEIYPSDKDVVNVANMRHLWIFAEPFPVAWRKS